MSSESTQTPAEGKRTRPISRWGVGSVSILQIALFAFVMLALNFLLSDYYLRRDFSRNGSYTLSPATTRYLASPAVRDRKDPVHVILAFRRSMPLYEQARAMCEEYVRLSDRHLVLEVLDPVRSPDRAQQVAAAYGITFRTDIVVIDARTLAEAAAASPDAAEKTKSAHVRFATSDNMVTYEVEQGQRKPVGFQGEDVITAGLVSALEGAPKKLYLIEDKSNLDSDGPNSSRAFLESTMLTQNVALEPVKIAGLAEIPQDASGVAVISPGYDFSEAELAVLEAYWNRPKSAILWTVGGAKETPPRLRGFLRAHGVTPRRDRIITRKSDQTVSTVRAVFTPGMDFTKDLAGKTTVFEGATSSLEVRENADDLLNRRIQPFSLIQSDAGFWGETKFGDGKESFDPREDHPGPLTIAAAVVRGSATDDRFLAATSRMVVIANTDFMSFNNLQEQNTDFLTSSLNWLVGREELAGIGPHPIGTYKLPILDAQVSFINRVNLFFLPAFALLTAALVWSARRV
jgi:hypothetical protein